VIVRGVGEGRQRLIDWYTLVKLTLKKKRYEYNCNCNSYALVTSV